MKTKIIQHQRKQITNIGINGIISFDTNINILTSEEIETNGSIPCCIYNVDIIFNPDLNREVLRLYNTADKRIVSKGKIFNPVYAYSAKKRINSSDILLDYEKKLFYRVAEWINQGLNVYWNIV